MNIKLARVSRASRRVSLTPLIDVVFILLVFFMLESSFSRTRSVTLAMPQGERASPTELIRIEVLAGTAVRLNGATLPDQEWSDVLIRQYRPSDSSVLVASGAGVSMQRLVQILDDLRMLGFTQLALSPAREPAS